MPLRADPALKAILLSRRRILWAGAAAAASVAAYSTVVESRWLEVTRTVVRVPPGTRTGDTLRVLHLSDLHASWAVPLSTIDSAITLGLAQEPDLICVTGDFISHREDFDLPAYGKLLRRLSLARPTFAVLGNHDGGIWARERRGYSDSRVVERLLDGAGIVLLHNRSTRIAVGDRTVTLAGVGDLWSKTLDASRAFRDVPAGSRTILLSHNPDSKDEVRRYPWDVMLCGHTHGGQVVFPVWGPHYAPVADKRFVAGLGSWEGRQIYVSRGVGNVGGFRLRCRPEVSILDVELA